MVVHRDQLPNVLSSMVVQMRLAYLSTEHMVVHRD
jgi:hypothetical protein